MKSWEALECLLGGYFHEDFIDLYGSAWGAVDSYAQGQPDYAPQLRREITELLSTCKSEAELDSALVDLGTCYLPEADGWVSYRAWLLAVADRVDEILHRSPVAGRLNPAAQQVNTRRMFSSANGSAGCG
jgi:CdiI immunity protein